MFFWKMENVNLKQFESLRQKRLLSCVLKKKRKKRRKRKRGEEERELETKTPQIVLWFGKVLLY